MMEKLTLPYEWQNYQSAIDSIAQALSQNQQDFVREHTKLINSTTGHIMQKSKTTSTSDLSDFNLTGQIETEAATEI